MPAQHQSSIEKQSIPSNTQPFPVLRIARPTNDIKSLLPFYTVGLGLRVLYEFKDHEGFDGIILGNSNSPYHFEFTSSASHDAGRAPTQDHLIIFYLPDRDVWEAAVRQMAETGFESVKSLNPYWDRQGLTFEDLDGYRVVLQCASWSA